MIRSLDEAADPRLFGGKAAQLSRGVRVGLPVPPGRALDWMQVEALARGERSLRAALEEVLLSLQGPLAVRSSAVGEDSVGASFAGQHSTRLGVRSPGDLLDAVLEVHASAFAPGVLGYRQRMGIEGPPRMGVVLQEMVHAECAGVLFTRNPVDGADERVIEAAWGLGEVVVAGLVTPDRYRLSREGHLLEQSPGLKDRALRWTESGVREEATGDELAGAPCLDE